MTSLYIHIPFCRRKCLYCSFAVFIGREKVFEPYIAALEKEAAACRGAALQTVYIGGGTPSILDAHQLRCLVAAIQKNFDVSRTSEWSFEANPEDIDSRKAALLFELGFDRISLGVQTFQEKYLKFLGRRHAADKAQAAFLNLGQAGIQNINIDLMFGFPGQTKKELEKDLDALLAFQSEHVSIYSLTVEAPSRFFVQKIQGLDKDRQAAFYERIIFRLDMAGFHQYEISNFSKPGKESLHNLNYWQGGNYIGLGVAAHSHKEGRRSWNTADLNKYMNCLAKGSSAEEGYEVLNPTERLLEALAFGLRMNAGVDLQGLQQRFAAVLPEEKNAKIREFIDAGFFTLRGDRLAATLRGRLVLDELASYLL